MIKRVYLIALFCLMVINTQAQKTRDLFVANNYKYVWFGVDYSRVKLIGDFYAINMGEEEPRQVIKDKYFKSWNDLIKNERRKYCVEDMLRKSEVIYDIKMMEEHNQIGSYESLEADKGESLSKEELTDLIKSYHLDYDSGIGIVIIAEYLDKSYKEASYVLEIFNIATREKLIEERFVTRPMGFGVRNYWAGSLYYIFKEVSARKYRTWKYEYKKK